MNKSVKTVAVILAVIIALAALYIFAPGARVVTSAYIDDFTVSEDKTEMTLRVGVGSSVGFIRSMKVQKKDDTLLLKFYSAFGGINGSIGAKDTFEIKLFDDTVKIAVCKGKDEYQTVLCKNKDGTWDRN